MNEKIVYTVDGYVWNKKSREYDHTVILSTDNLDLAKRKFYRLASELNNDMTQVSVEKDDGFDVERIFLAYMYDGELTVDDYSKS